MKNSITWLSAAVLISISLLPLTVVAESAIQQTKGSYQDKFRQLDETLPTPNVYRSAAGEPGENYWQQRADYDIRVTLNEAARRIDASETITYHNNSPYTLRYIWIQLDQNIFRNDSMAERSSTFSSRPEQNLNGIDKPARISLGQLRRQQFMADNELGFEIKKISDSRGQGMDFVVVGTKLRLDLPQPLKPGQKTEFGIDFGFNIVESDAVGARSGYEHFPDDEREGGNDIFLMAQWYPRVTAFTDYEAWTNKEFLGSGEFTMEFGDFEVEITVPADHIVSASGVLQNPRDVLTATQRQ
ncbi:MAG TPA: aminopeptidase, partial [Pseudidiomarina sp.]|nr:aminopeptidase [Pseudidiomarina sp.]